MFIQRCDEEFLSKQLYIRTRELEMKSVNIGGPVISEIEIGKF